MNYGKTFDPLGDELLASLHLRASSFVRSPSFPLAEAYRGGDPTLGDRYRQHFETVQAMCLRGSPNSADLVAALEEAGYLVVYIEGAAQPHSGPMLTYLSMPLVLKPKLDFLGLEKGTISSYVTIRLVVFEKV